MLYTALGVLQDLDIRFDFVGMNAIAKTWLHDSHRSVQLRYIQETIRKD